MQFIVAADTDIGISKKNNQDSLLIKHGRYEGKDVLMALICDGMGGLEKGELASAEVVRAFSKWFDEELPEELEHVDVNVIGAKWSLLLKELNAKILDYSRTHYVDGIGTTFSGILFVNDEYVIAHVGDSRIYQIGAQMNQLTEDQTFVAREIRKGNMTAEQAKNDKRRNLLLQCVGASRTVEPQILCGKTEKGAYMICSDGFRHEITEQEMYLHLSPDKQKSKEEMYRNIRVLIEMVKSRKEKDNISALLIKVD